MRYSEDLAIPGVSNLAESCLSVMSLRDKDQWGLSYRLHYKESCAPTWAERNFWATHCSQVVQGDLSVSYPVDQNLCCDQRCAQSSQWQYLKAHGHQVWPCRTSYNWRTIPSREWMYQMCAWLSPELVYPFIVNIFNPLIHKPPHCRLELWFLWQ